ncbi:hypothetical protein DWX23_11435 [Parabacteroides sp. AF18-52]|nr:hypothetical protein DWX23_11435 [Parabacteroides sp. AF18-52]
MEQTVKIKQRLFDFLWNLLQIPYFCICELMYYLIYGINRHHIVTSSGLVREYLLDTSFHAQIPPELIIK